MNGLSIIDIITINMTPTFENLIDFIMSHKTNKVFRGLSLLEIAAEVKMALDDNTLYYATEGDKIIGMILAIKSDSTKSLNVRRNLAMSIKTLRLFASKAKAQFPGYKLEWEKHNIWKRPNTEKLYKKLGII